MYGFGRDDHRLPLSQQRGARRRVGIAGPEMARIVGGLAVQQALGGAGGQPAALLGDADRHHVVFVLVDCVENGGG